MNTAISTPDTSGPATDENGSMLPSGISNGLSQESDGSIASGPASPAYDLDERHHGEE